MKSLFDTKRSAFYSALALVLVTLGCGPAGPPPGLKGVSGKVTVDGQPAPEGTRIEFHHSSGDYTFTVRTKTEGAFHYLPAKEAPLKKGAYQIAVLPPAAATKVAESGVTVSEKATGPKNYGDYSNSQKSGIQADLGEEVVTLDIAVKT